MTVFWRATLDLYRKTPFVILVSRTHGGFALASFSTRHRWMPSYSDALSAWMSFAWPTGGRRISCFSVGLFLGALTASLTGFLLAAER